MRSTSSHGPYQWSPKPIRMAPPLPPYPRPDVDRRGVSTSPPRGTHETPPPPNPTPARKHLNRQMAPAPRWPCPIAGSALSHSTTSGAQTGHPRLAHALTANAVAPLLPPPAACGDRATDKPGIARGRPRTYLSPPPQATTGHRPGPPLPLPRPLPTARPPCPRKSSFSVRPTHQCFKQCRLRVTSVSRFAATPQPTRSPPPTYTSGWTYGYYPGTCTLSPATDTVGTTPWRSCHTPISPPPHQL